MGDKAVVEEVLAEEHGMPLQEWKYGPGSCCEDCGICMQAFCCAPCLHGMNTHKMARGHCFPQCLLFYVSNCFGLCGMVGACNRQEVRKQCSLKGSDTAACCFYTWCTACALCQDALEIRHHQSMAQFSTVDLKAPVTQQME